MEWNERFQVASSEGVKQEWLHKLPSVQRNVLLMYERKV